MRFGDQLHCVWYFISSPTLRTFDVKFSQELGKYLPVFFIISRRDAINQETEDELRQEIFEKMPWGGGTFTVASATNRSQLPQCPRCRRHSGHKELKAYVCECGARWPAEFKNEVLDLLALTMIGVHKQLRDTPGEKNSTQISASINIILVSAGGAGGAGFVPVPILDLALVIGVQAVMLSSLCAAWCLPIKKFPLKSLQLFIGPALATGLAMLKGTILKFVPVVGSAPGTILNSVLGAALTAVFGVAYTIAFAQITSTYSFEKLHGLNQEELYAAIKPFVNATYLKDLVSGFVTPGFAQAVCQNNWRKHLENVICDRLQIQIPGSGTVRSGGL